MRALTQEEMQEIKRKIQLLETIKRALTTLAEAYLVRGPVASCSMLESIGPDQATHKS